MKLPLSFFLFLFSTFFSFGQNYINHEFLSSADIRVGIPLGQFKDNIDANAVGLGGYTMFHLWDSGFFAGVEGSWLGYARETLREGRLDRRTNCHIITGHAALQFQPPLDSPIKPYFVGMIGFKNLYTRTRLIDERPQGDRIVERESNLKDWAFSYGGAVGLYISLGDLPFLIDLRLAYLRGTNANYYARNEAISIQTVDQPIEVFEQKWGGTNMLMPQIGLVLAL